MARTEIPIVVIDPATGNAISGASVAVAVRSTAAAATVYAGETGATTVSSTRTTDSYGRLTGWVERGAYTLTVSGSGLTTYVKNWDSAPAADGTMDGLWIAQGAVAIGFQALTTSYVTTGTHTAYQDEGLSASVTYRANRLLRASWNGGLYAGGGAQKIKVQLLRGSTTVYEFISPTAVNSIVTEAWGFSIPFAGPATAATETFKLQIAAYTSNTSVQSSGGASSPRSLLIEDLGPR